MHIRLVFLIVSLIAVAAMFINIPEITWTFAQEFEEEDTVGLSGRSIEEAQGNITELTANKTGFEEEDTIGLSGRSIEEANK
jgi:hypothetical protein